MVLIGMEQIQRNINRFKQISSRIAQVVEFTPRTAADVTRPASSSANTS